MKHYPAALVVLASLLSAPAALSQTSAWYHEARLSGDSGAPSGNPAQAEASPSRPLNLSGVRSFRVTVCAVTGTLASGQLQLWFYHGNVGGSGHWMPHGDYVVFIPADWGHRCYFQTYPWSVRVGWLAVETIGVDTTPAAQDVTVRIDPDSV